MEDSHLCFKQPAPLLFASFMCSGFKKSNFYLILDLFTNKLFFVQSTMFRWRDNTILLSADLIIVMRLTFRWVSFVHNSVLFSARGNTIVLLFHLFSKMCRVSFLFSITGSRMNVLFAWRSYRPESCLCQLQET